MNDILFLFLYLITSVILVVVQGLCFLYSVKFNTLFFVIVYVISVFFLGGTQFHILKYGSFPYGLLSNLNVYASDSLVMYTATFFMWVHGLVLPLLLNVLTQPKRRWKE